MGTSPNQKGYAHLAPIFPLRESPSRMWRDLAHIPVRRDDSCLDRLLGGGNVRRAFKNSRECDAAVHQRIDGRNTTLALFASQSSNCRTASMRQEIPRFANWSLRL